MVSYCGTGVTASILALAAELLDFHLILGLLAALSQRGPQPGVQFEFVWLSPLAPPPKRP